MRKLKSQGRMIRQDVSHSYKIASLSWQAGFLFFMLIPHLNSYGKMNGSPYFIKGEVVPLVNSFTIPIIEECLKEINDKTNLKWFEYAGRMWLHSINWEEHQELRKDRRGNDNIPDYSQTTPGVVQHEVEDKDQDKDQDKEKIYKKEKEFFLLWNQFALKSNLISARELSDRRKQKASKRLSERPLVEWEEVFSLCARTSFLNGLSKDGWRASFDWITASYDNAVKILEGKYGQPLDEFCTPEVLEKLQKEGGNNGRNRHRESQQRTSAAPGDITTKQDIYTGIGKKISTDE